jgi:hypothetical protein
MREYTYPCLTRIADGVVTGRSYNLGDLRRCLSAGPRVEAIDDLLLDLSRILDTKEPVPDQVVADRTGFEDRLRAFLAVLDEISPLAEDPDVARTGSVHVATLPGDRDAGGLLWRRLLADNGYGVRALGVKAPPIIASHAARETPDGLVLHIGTPRVRAAVQAVVVNLLRKGTRVPLLVGGPGVDADFAQWVAVPGGGQPYWGGVYYCEDAREMLEVLRKVVLYEPPPVAHSHDWGDLAEGGCTGCDACSLAAACDLR